MIRSSLFTRPALGLALALGIAAGGLAVSAPAVAKEKKEKAPDPKAALANSKEFATAAAPVMAMLKEAQSAIQKFQTAQGAEKDAALAEMKSKLGAGPSHLATAELAIKTPGDRLLAGQWGMTIGSILEDQKLIQHAAQNVVDSGVASPEQQIYYGFRLGAAAYTNGDFPTAIKALGPVVASNYSDDVAAEMLVVAYGKSGQAAQGLAALKSAVSARKAAGGAVPNRWYERGVEIAHNAGLKQETIDWALSRLAANSTKFNWVSAAQIMRLDMDYNMDESIDISRAIDAAGALNGNSTPTQREYVEYLQAAIGRAGVLYPGEVVKVATNGLTVGALRKSDPFVTDALNEGNRRAPADKASLTSAYTQAKAPAATAKSVMITADALLSYDMDAQAEELYLIALGKPGVDAATANLRLGIAQLGQGKAEEAKASFAKVEGRRKSIADLWALVATSGAGSAR